MPNKYLRNTPVLPVFFIAIDLLVIFLVFLFHFLLSKGMYTDFLLLKDSSPPHCSNLAAQPTNLHGPELFGTSSI